MEGFQSMRSSKISALSYQVPDNIYTHKQLQDLYGEEKMERLAESTGIYNRRVCSREEIASDLAFKCANRILDSQKFTRESIDLIIVATQMPDYLLPTTACIMQDRLGLSKNCAAFDINLGCSQFVYAHGVAHSMISAGLIDRALVITCDTPSKIIDDKDMTVVPLFGDGATATILDVTEDGTGYKDFVFGSDGSEHEALIWPKSGLRDSTDGMASGREVMIMDGQKIFLFTLQVVPKYIRALLSRNNISETDIGFFAIHQASKLIVDSIARKLKIKDGQLNRIYPDYETQAGLR